MSAHTLGPWRIAGKGTIRSGNDHWIASVHWANRGPNARLIAAAPDLLDSLESCVRFLNKHCPGAEHIIDAAEAAIALATGETPR